MTTDLSRVRATDRQAWALVSGGAVMIAGLISDGWAHTNLLGELDSFFTPYHATIFLGYLMAAASLAWVAASNLSTGRSVREALPDGYRLGAIGVAGFGTGFVGDGIWHTFLGIEADIDALLSPTHLLMFASVLLIFTSPVRDAWRRPGGRDLEDGRRWLVLAATTLTVVTIAFFVLYVWGIGSAAPAPSFTAFTAGFPSEGFVSELGVIWGLAGTFITTIVLVAPLLLLWRRWDLPFGAAALLFSVPAVLLAAVREFRTSSALPAVLIAGLLVDWLAQRLRPAPERPRAARWAAAAAAALLWSLYFGMFALTEGMGWEPEIWSGAIVFSAIIAYGLGLLAYPPESGRPPAR